MIFLCNKLCRTSLRLTLIAGLLLFVSACATNNNTSGTIASLENVTFEVVDEKVDNSLEKAMASYEEFLKNTPETEMTPEALRRLADLKIQREQSLIEEEPETTSPIVESSAVERSAGIKPTTNTAVADSASQNTALSSPQAAQIAAFAI